ncbi:rRNA-processing protein las1, partial [Dimargaris verticillata]
MSHCQRLVPWVSQHEFDQVLAWLYADPNDRAQRLQGVQRVKAWITRGKVPLSVEATARLVEAQLRDQSAQTGQFTRDERRHLYAATFIRFFNLLVDTRQTGRYAQAVSKLAAQLGMPPWFADIRHAATHGDMPSLAILRTVCQDALDWLYTHYWDQQQTADLSAERHDTHVLLSQCRQRRHDFVQQHPPSHASGNPKSHTTSAHPALVKNDVEMCTTVLIQSINPDALAELLIPALLDVGHLVPTAKRQRATYPDLTLDQTLYHTWWPVVCHFAAMWPSFTEALVQGIVEIIVVDPEALPSNHPAQSNSYRLTLTAWLKLILEAYFDRSTPQFTLLPFASVMEACLRKPGLFTRAILQAIAQAQPMLAPQLEPFINIMGKVLYSELQLTDKLTAEAFTEDALHQEAELFMQRYQEIKHQDSRSEPEPRDPIKY